MSNWTKKTIKSGELNAPTNQPVKDSYGNLVFSTEDQLKVWYNHYKSLASDFTHHSFYKTFWSNPAWKISYQFENTKHGILIRKYHVKKFKRQFYLFQILKLLAQMAYQSSFTKLLYIRTIRKIIQITVTIFYPYFLIKFGMVIFLHLGIMLLLSQFLKKVIFPNVIIIEGFP